MQFVNVRLRRSSATNIQISFGPSLLLFVCNQLENAVRLPIPHAVLVNETTLSLSGIERQGTVHSVSKTIAIFSNQALQTGVSNCSTWKTELLRPS